MSGLARRWAASRSVKNSCSVGASAVTLEVRVSNGAARQFYRSYGFAEAYRRRAYYQDGEDAFAVAVNGKQVRTARLAPGDEIALGTARLRFNVD